MKIIEKNANIIANISMYVMDADGITKSNDVSDDFFNGCHEVEDVGYCIREVQDWVDGKGDFTDADANEKRLAIINGLLYTNYEM